MVIHNHRLQNRDAMHTVLDTLDPGETLEGFRISDVPSIHHYTGIQAKDLRHDIMALALPSFLELILTQLTAMVDMIMVGGLGAFAIAAVGLTNQPKQLLSVTFLALNIGVTAAVAKRRGAAKREEANEIFHQSLLLSGVLAILTSLLGCLFAEPMVRFMGASDAQTLEAGIVYLQIQMLGFFFLPLTSTITAALRAVGDARSAVLYNLAGNVVNVIFNWLLIEGRLSFPAWGIAGASVATVMGQVISFLLAMAVMLSNTRYIGMSKGIRFRLERRAVGEIVHVGLPAVFERLLLRIGVILFVRTVAGLGTTALAVHQICMNIQSFSTLNGHAFAVASTTITGQCVGKKRLDMVVVYLRQIILMAMALAVVTAGAFLFGGRWIVGLYSGEETIILLGSRIMRYVSMVLFLQVLQLIFAGALRGAGDTKSVAIVMLATTLWLRPVLAYIAVSVLDWGLDGVWVALLTDQIVRSTFTMYRFQRGYWHH